MWTTPIPHPKEFHRATFSEFTPKASFIEVYASGIRNCVGEAINPITGQLWCSTNERDDLGNHLVPPRLRHFHQGRWLLRMAVVLHGRPSGSPSPRAMRKWHGPQPAGSRAHSGRGEDLQARRSILEGDYSDVLFSRTWRRLRWSSNPTGKKEFPAAYDGDAFAAEPRLLESQEPRRV